MLLNRNAEECDGGEDPAVQDWAGTGDNDEQGDIIEGFSVYFELKYLNTTLTQGTIDDAEQFLEQHSKLLHPNHYHMTTCKHNLMQVSLS